MNTTENVLTELRALLSYNREHGRQESAAMLENAINHIAALVEAASRMNRSFYFLTDTRGSVHKCVNVASLESFNAAIKDIES